MEYGEIGRSAFALFFVIGLLFGIAYLAKRFNLQKKLQGLAKEGRRIQLIESFYLDARNRILLVRCDQKEYVVLIGAAQPLLLDTREINSDAQKTWKFAPPNEA